MVTTHVVLFYNKRFLTGYVLHDAIDVHFSFQYDSNILSFHSVLYSEISTSNQQNFPITHRHRTAKRKTQYRRWMGYMICVHTTRKKQWCNATNQSLYPVLIFDKFSMHDQWLSNIEYDRNPSRSINQALVLSPEHCPTTNYCLEVIQSIYIYIVNFRNKNQKKRTFCQMKALQNWILYIVLVFLCVFLYMWE